MKPSLLFMNAALLFFHHCKIRRRIIFFFYFFSGVFFFPFSSNGQTIFAGLRYSRVVCSSGLVMGFGANGGYLGDGTDTSRTTPVTALLTGITSIAGSGEHTLSLKYDSTVWASGGNYYGACGTGTSTVFELTPVQVINLTGITAVAGGMSHSLALKYDGTVWAWGRNVEGQLGDGTDTNRFTPVRVNGLTGITAISASEYQSFALRNDGTLWSWGGNLEGVLGDGTDTNRFSPVHVHNVTGIIAISSGDVFSLALKNDGTVWVWGSNNNGEMGDGTFGGPGHFLPAQVPSLSGIIAISAGGGTALALKADGTIWAWGWNGYGNCGIGNAFDVYIPVQVHILTGVTAISAGFSHSIALKNDGTLWSWGSNDFGELGNVPLTTRDLPGLVPNLCYIAPSTIIYPHYVNGVAYHDSTNDCTREAAEQRLSFIPVVATPGNLYAQTNDSGFFSLGINNSVNYTITPIVPQYLSHMIQNPCPVNHVVNLNSTATHDSSGFDYGFDVTPCAQLRIDLSSNRKRRCSWNHMSVYYWNEGNFPADSVTVNVKFAQYDIPVAASLPFTINASDSSIVFNIGTLNAGQHGNIEITDSVACLPDITGLTQCTKAWILPTNQCLLDSTTGSNWDHSSISVGATCLNDTLHFAIYNNGNNMTAASQYRVYTNNGYTDVGSFQLLSGDSLEVVVVPAGATIRLEADQNPGHPGNSNPRATVEACGTSGSGTFSIGQVNQAPMDDADVNVEIDCMQIRDSYDPNEKENSPEGIDAAHIILPGTQIDFVIHFQNTGTDTAYKVVITDSISGDFDLSTLELGASSHPYLTSISGAGNPVLKFTFDNINLVDSATDELNSSGFVKYKISPKPFISIGTIIRNTAEIYFDYNSPIRTNTAFVTIGNYVVLSLNSAKATKAGEIIFYPSPTTGVLTIETIRSQPLKKIIVYSMEGRNVQQEIFRKSEKVEIDLSALAGGVYFLDCISEQHSQKIKVVKY